LGDDKALTGTKTLDVTAEMVEAWSRTEDQPQPPSGTWQTRTQPPRRQPRVGRALSRAIARNGRSRLRLSGPQASCCSYTYDPLGHVGRMVDGPSDLTYSYDRAERLTQVRETGGYQRTLRSFTFATANGSNDWAKGKLRQATANNWYDPGVPTSNFLSQETYTYGGVGGRVSQRDTLAGIVGGFQGTFTQGFTWSDLGLPATVTYPQKSGVGPARTVTFDLTNGWLTRVHEGTTNYASSISYHANGMVNQVVHPNNTTDTFGKDPNDLPRPAYAKVQGLLGLTLWNTGTYTYDGSGNVWKMTNGSNIDTFFYDKASRLLEGKILSVSKKQCQSYDAFGNIKGQATTSSSLTCTPSTWSVDSSTNRMGSPVTYDAAGEQTSWNSGAYVYWWYPTGEMRQFDGSNRATVYGYTADSERVATYDSLLGTITYTLRGLDGKVLRVYRESGGVWTWLQDYVYRDGAHVATIDSSGTRYFHLDHLGTIRLITNSSGTQVALHTYLPFGQEATSTSQDSEAMKFTGHERDLRDPSNTTDDLDAMHARYYNLNLARFLIVDPGRNVDPKAPQASNMYAYARNNPVKYIDPNGRQVAPPTAANPNVLDPFTFAMSAYLRAPSAVPHRTNAEVMGRSLADLGTFLARGTWNRVPWAGDWAKDNPRLVQQYKHQQATSGRDGGPGNNGYSGQSGIGAVVASLAVRALDIVPGGQTVIAYAVVYGAAWKALLTNIMTGGNTVMEPAGTVTQPAQTIPVDPTNNFREFEEELIRQQLGLSAGCQFYWSLPSSAGTGGGG
jgi:RHS repeat-associated protein